MQPRYHEPHHISDDGHIQWVDGRAGWVNTSLVRLHDIKIKLEAVARGQEVLEEAHKDLLVERSQVCSAYKSLSAQRSKAVQSEVLFMNKLREYYLDRREDLPKTLSTAWDAVLEDRDKVGEKEDEYLRAERKLGGSEWDFMDKERVFYQYEIQNAFTEVNLNPASHDSDAGSPRSFQPVQLPPPPPRSLDLFPEGKEVEIPNEVPPPPPAPLLPISISPFSIPHHAQIPPTLSKTDALSASEQYQMVLTRLNHLRWAFDSLRSEQNTRLNWAENVRMGFIPNDDMDSKFVDTYSSLLSSISECEVALRHWGSLIDSRKTALKDSNGGKAEQSSPNLTKFKGTVVPHRVDSPIASVAATEPFTDIGQLFQTELANGVREARIEDWLLDILRENSLERNIYQNFVKESGVYSTHASGYSITQFAEQNWALDMEPHHESDQNAMATSVIDKEGPDMSVPPLTLPRPSEPTLSKTQDTISRHPRPLLRKSSDRQASQKIGDVSLLGVGNIFDDDALTPQHMIDRHSFLTHEITDIPPASQHTYDVVPMFVGQKPHRAVRFATSDEWNTAHAHELPIITELRN